jgi:hypothetical protein
VTPARTITATQEQVVVEAVTVAVAVAVVHRPTIPAAEEEEVVVVVAGIAHSAHRKCPAAA